MKRPPKKCSVCHKPLQSYAIIDVKINDTCQCRRCLCNILESKREPGVCDECKAEETKET